MFNKENILTWLRLAEAKTAYDEPFQCFSRDVFQAGLDNLYVTLKDPLLVAVAGEIGNNAFDHNLGSWRDIAGIYFRVFAPERTLVIADRGQGVRKTLSRIIPGIPNDKAAVEMAFTRLISGRSPEQRGNGLKFVALAAKQDNWNFYFHSGNGVAIIEHQGLSFHDSIDLVNGCLAIINY